MVEVLAMKILGWILYFVLVGIATYLFKYNQTFSVGWRYIAVIGNAFCWLVAVNLLNYLFKWRFWQ